MAKLTTLGILVLVVLLGAAAAVAAEADTAEWSKVNIPTEGRAGGWGLAPGSDLTNLSLAAGVIYLNKLDGESRLMRSEDGGSSWAATGYQGGAVVDIVCHSDTDTIYLTDGRHVYKSDDGEGFELVGEGSLPNFDATNERIACLDVGDNTNHPVVFIGTADDDTGQYGGVYYLTEGDFGAGWTDMMAEGYDIYAIAAAPQFDHSFRLVALASDGNHSYIINNRGTAGGWSERTELLKDNTDSFVPNSASRIVFPDDFNVIDELFVGVSSNGSGGVYRVNPGGAQELGPEAAIISLDIAEDDGIELVVSTFAAFDNPTILKTDDYALPTTAWQCNISLNYDTTYYWKVRAVSANSCSAWSAVSAFSTEPEPSDPPGTVAETPAPTPTPQNQTWPDWLLPAGGIVLLVVVLTMIAMVIVMVFLVIKLSKL